MVTVILSHEVADFSQWKKGFDAGEDFRVSMGVSTIGVYTSVDNENHVSIITEFPSVDAVSAMMSSPELQASMKEAGVIGKPEAKILNKA